MQWFGRVFSLLLGRNERQEQKGRTYKLLNPPRGINSVQIQKPHKPKGAKRRDSIITSFMSALEKRGYANTTMSCVAKEADIARSHLFYYFASTEEILFEVFKTQCDVIVAGIEATPQKTFEDKVVYVADFFFTENSSVNHMTTGVMYQAIGASVHTPALAAHKQELDQHCIRLLSAIFANCGISHEECTERAEILYALIAGSKLNSFFSSNPSLNLVRERFIYVANLLGQLPIEGAAQSNACQ